jgi:hypothetical protein
LQNICSYFQVIFYMSSNLTTWGLQLYFPSEGRHVADFIALKNPSPWPGFNPQPSGQMASTLTMTPPTRLNNPCVCMWSCIFQMTPQPKWYIAHSINTQMLSTMYALMCPQNTPIT